MNTEKGSYLKYTILKWLNLTFLETMHIMATNSLRSCFER